MPRIVSTLEFAPGAKDRIWQMMTRVYEQLARVVNGGISFGIAPGVGLPDGITQPPDRKFSDNIDAVWVEFVTPATANTTFTIIHGFNKPLSAYIIARKSAPVELYDAPEQATNTNSNQVVMLRATTASTKLVLLLF